MMGDSKRGKQQRDSTERRRSFENTMTPEQQRIAIAQACGWTDTPIVGGKYGQADVPDYLEDLNAMHEAEKVLTHEQFDDYYVRLCIKIARPYHATAAQRAEAFLRTLGLWKERP